MIGNFIVALVNWLRATVFLIYQVLIKAQNLLKLFTLMFGALQKFPLYLELVTL
ncbi:hypothetical protein AXF42_Ash010200 [Apostasia shenzhenica]|uniref:Uncharacterized protein n=1 Tax=Apostasia shenzhenica TaxID=1088818 RepID=A0A2I0A9U5_9ASPA|nr:hypothetical protein AXF42_Ash010200 [Apostasia shenzhenica]